MSNISFKLTSINSLGTSTVVLIGTNDLCTSICVSCVIAGGIITCQILLNSISGSAWLLSLNSREINFVVLAIMLLRRLTRMSVIEMILLLLLILSYASVHAVLNLYSERMSLCVYQWLRSLGHRNSSVLSLTCCNASRLCIG